MWPSKKTDEHGAGTALVRIVLANRRPAGAPLGGLKITAGDAFLVLSYSTFTSACDGDGGNVKIREGLAARFPIAAGEWDVWLSPKPPSWSGGLVFECTFAAAHRRANDHLRSITAHP